MLRRHWYCQHAQWEDWRCYGDGQKDCEAEDFKESENKDENLFGIGESVDQIQNISSRILVKAGDRRLVLLRRQRLNSLPKSRSSEEIKELKNPESRVVDDGSSEKKEFTGITHANQPDREIQVWKAGKMQEVQRNGMQGDF